MNQYTIYCTEEQTRKALELGAPIIEMPFRTEMTPNICNKYGFIHFNNTYYVIPTTEQMIGWLEEQEPICSIELGRDNKNKVWLYIIFIDKGETDICKFPTRREATIAAIDAALELANNKQLAKQ